MHDGNSGVKFKAIESNQDYVYFNEIERKDVKHVPLGEQYYINIANCWTHYIPLTI